MSRYFASFLIGRARTLIANPLRWIQGCPATFKNGAEAPPHHARAYAFCATGALFKVAYDIVENVDDAREMVDSALSALFPGHDLPAERLQAINDGRLGHSRVLTLFDEFMTATTAAAIAFSNRMADADRV